MSREGAASLLNRAWRSRFRYVLIVAVVGFWIAVAVLVGLATSSGVVWF